MKKGTYWIPILCTRSRYFILTCNEGSFPFYGELESENNKNKNKKKTGRARSQDNFFLDAEFPDQKLLHM